MTWQFPDCWLNNKYQKGGKCFYDSLTRIYRQHNVFPWLEWVPVDTEFKRNSGWGEFVEKRENRSLWAISKIFPAQFELQPSTARQLHCTSSAGNSERNPWLHNSKFVLRFLLKNMLFNISFTKPLHFSRTSQGVFILRAEVSWIVSSLYFEG